MTDRADTLTEAAEAVEAEADRCVGQQHDQYLSGLYGAADLLRTLAATDPAGQGDPLMAECSCGRAVTVTEAPDGMVYLSHGDGGAFTPGVDHVITHTVTQDSPFPMTDEVRASLEPADTGEN